MNGQANYRSAQSQSRSVQAQFSLLTSEKEEFRNITATADRDRRNEENKAKTSRSNQAVLAGQIQMATAALGTSTKKLQLLRREEARLKKCHEVDSANTVRLSDELGRMTKDEEERRSSFVKEMDGCNDELIHAMNQYEERRLGRYVSVGSVEGAVLLRLASLVEAANAANDSESGGGDPSSSIDDPSGGGGGGSGGREWQELSDRVVARLGDLRESTSILDAKMTTKAGLEEQIPILRAKMMQGQNLDGRPFSEMECDEIERLWDENWQQGEAMDEEEEAPQCGDPDISNKGAGAGGAQNTTASMDLFYGGMEIANQNDGAVDPAAADMSDTFMQQ